MAERHFQAAGAKNNKNKSPTSTGQKVVLTITIIKDKLDIFYTIKTIPFKEVVRSFEGQEPNLSGKILCPFHKEKTASFHVYEDSGHCFGCGWHGDSVSFVSQSKKLPPIEAALRIAERFGLAADQSLIDKKHCIIDDLKRKRKLLKYYKELEAEAFLNMANFRSKLINLLDNIGIDDIDPNIERAVHWLPIIEDQMMTLASGDLNKRVQLLKEGVINRWIKKI